MREIDTRLVPWEHREIAYALNRWDRDRTPVPRPGDRVYYRRHEWDQEPTPATVLQVADLEDREDPNLWHPVRDNTTGAQMFDGEIPMIVRAPDPLPWVDLEPDDAVAAFGPGEKRRCGTCGQTHEARVARTWEARVRGMPGWLPLGWRDRGVKLPGEIVMRPVEPAYRRWLAQSQGR